MRKFSSCCLFLVHLRDLRVLLSLVCGLVAWGAFQPLLGAVNGDLNTCEIIVTGREADFARMPIILGGPLPPTYYVDQLLAEFKIKENSWAYAMIQRQMAGKLFDQHDPLFQQQGLIIPEGGLCNPTCGANVLGSLIETLPGDALGETKDPRYMVNDYIGYINASYQRNGLEARDPRLGSGLLDMQEYIHASVALGNLPTGLETQMVWNVALEKIIPKAHEIVLIVVRTPTELDGHTVAVLAYNPGTQKALIFDPNFRAIFIKAYLEQREGTLYLNQNIYPDHATGEPLPAGTIVSGKPYIALALKLKYDPLGDLTPDMEERYRR